MPDHEGRPHAEPGRLSRRRLLQSAGAMSVGSFVGITRGQEQVGGDLLWKTDRLIGNTSYPVITDSTVLATSIDREENVGVIWAGDQQDGSTRWSATTGVSGSLRLTADNKRVYFAVTSANEDTGAIAAADIRAGTQQWGKTFESGQLSDPYTTDEQFTTVTGDRLSIPSVANDRVFLSDTGNDTLRAFNATDGSQEWERDVSQASNIPTGLGTAVVAEGTVFVNSGIISRQSKTLSNGTLFTFNPEDGDLRWRRSLGGYGEPATVSDGTVILSSHVTYSYRSILKAFNTASGSQQWELQVPGTTYVPTVADQTVFASVRTIGSTDTTDTDIIMAIDAANGVERWKTEIDGKFGPGGRRGLYRSAPTVVDDVVFVSTNKFVYAIDAADGTELWRHSTDQPVTGALTVVGGTVFVPVAGGLRALDAGLAGSSDDSRVRQGLLGHHDGLRGASVTVSSRRRHNVTVDVREKETNKVTTVSVTDAAAGDSVTVPLNLRLSGTVSVRELVVTPKIDGAFELTITSDDQPLETTPSVLTVSGEERRAYFDTDKTLDNSDATEAAFQYEAHVGFLDIASTLADEEIESVAFRYELDSEAMDDAELEEIKMYRFDSTSDPPQWTAYPTEAVVRSETARFETTAPGFSQWTVGARQPSLTITEPTAEASTTRAGDEVTIEVTIQNPDRASDVYVTELLRDGAVIERRRPRIPADGSIVIKFTRKVGQTETYGVRVNDAVVKTISVEDTGTNDGTEYTQQSSLGSGSKVEDQSPLWLFALGGLGALGGGGYFLRRRGDTADQSACDSSDQD